MKLQWLIGMELSVNDFINSSMRRAKACGFTLVMTLCDTHPLRKPIYQRFPQEFIDSMNNEDPSEVTNVICDGLQNMNYITKQKQDLFIHLSGSIILNLESDGIAWKRNWNILGLEGSVVENISILEKELNNFISTCQTIEQLRDRNEKFRDDLEKLEVPNIETKEPLIEITKIKKEIRLPEEPLNITPNQLFYYSSLFDMKNRDLYSKIEFPFITCDENNVQETRNLDSIQIVYN